MVALFEKRPGGRLCALPHEGRGVFPSVTAFQAAIQDADQRNRLDQLVLVGSASDLAWVHGCLPESVARRTMAEIAYPLVGGWFREAAPLEGLRRALEQVLAS